MAKLVATETGDVLRRIAPCQILGGDGLTKEYRPRRTALPRRARACRSSAGTSEMAKYLIAVDRPSFAQAQPVTRDRRNARMDIASIFIQSAERYPKHTALIFEDRRWTIP
jgi:hypothetical protein